MEKIRIGVIGIGDISDVYLNNLEKYDAVRSSPAPHAAGEGTAQGRAAWHPQGIRLGAEVIADPDVEPGPQPDHPAGAL